MKKILYLIIIIILSYNKAYANNVGFVDLDYLIKNSLIGKAALENIEKKDKKNINILKKKNKKLIDFENDIKSKKNIISAEAYEEEINILKKKISEYSKEKNKIVRDFDQFKKRELDEVFKKITPIIEEYMNNNNINIILDTKYIFMGKSNSNLTELILIEINNSNN
mgnify:CR=1 FL=1